MRILHTADWHLGRLFYGTHLTDDQSYVLEQQFFNVLKEEHIDVVLISGDIFDRSVPPVEAIALWDMVMSKLTLEYKIPTIVISGNHDSGARLAMGRNIFANENFFVVGQPVHGLEPIVFSDKYGPITFSPFPFSEPREFKHALQQAPQEDLFAHLIDEDEEQDCFSRYVETALHTSQKKGKRHIALSHGFVAGGLESASERPLLVGGTDAIHPTVFKGFHYTALGHLHRPQTAGSEKIRYSGSLLPYSFDEISIDRYGHDKSFTIVDMDKYGDIHIELIPIESKHQLVIVEGYFQDIIKREDWHRIYHNDYVLVRLLDGAPIIDGMARLRNVFPKVVGLELVGRVLGHNEQVQVGSFKQMREEELFNHFVEFVRKEPLSKIEEEHMAYIWEQVRKREL